MNRLCVSLGVIATLTGVTSIHASAQTPAPGAASVASAALNGRATVAEVRRVLAANYVLPEVRSKLDAALARGMAAGRYDVTDPEELARRINSDLASVTPDKHLGISYDPEQAAALAQRPPGDDGPPTADDIRRAAARNHGIFELKILPGNVRYMEIRGFSWVGPTSARAYDEAMRFLSEGDAVIIDVRRNGGGDPEAVRYLISHFLEPNRPIMNFYLRTAAAQEWRTLETLPAGRLIGKPLYVLSSGLSASAAEEFLGHVSGFGIGEVIGENSAGAGFLNDLFPLPGGLVLSVSVGRAVLVSTGKDWEGVGIAPTTKVEAAKALDVARIHAMRRVATTSAPEVRVSLEGQANLLEAQVNPVSPTLPLSAYVGQYGERILTAEGGRLSWQRRAGSDKLPLTPNAANEFLFDDDPTVRVAFKVESGKVVTVELIRADGSRTAFPRTP